jgi:serine/threonine protein kinase/tetratricopeptide (TPR) repeat protein
LQTGSTVGPYVVSRHLGDGGRGSVWLAEDTRLHRQVALKTLRTARQTDVAGRERLMREARAAAALNDPHIATVYDVLDIDGDVTIVFEYVEGATLATTLADGRLPLERVLQIGIQLTKALIAAHQHGVIHRDLKPSNVIVGKDGEIKVLDFGIARLMPAASTRTSPLETGSAVFLGTPAYAAPEQLFTSAVDERADLYSLGVMLFEMAAGRRPYAGRDLMEVAAARLAEKSPSLSSTGTLVPPAFDALVTQLLSQHPTDRPASAAEVLGSLRTIAGDQTGPLPLRRGRSPRWIAAAVVLCVTIGGALFSLRLPERTSSSDRHTPVVAVMPLRNQSGDPTKDYLAAGLSESVIASLASSPSLIVLSRTAVADAVKNGADVDAVMKQLGASYVVDGSVQQSGDQLRIAVNLVQPDHSLAWGRTFDGTIERVFDLQTRMSLALAEAMSAGRPPVATAAPANQSALEAYWRGRAFLDRWDVTGNIDASVAALQQSIAADSKFALAHAALGVAYWRKYQSSKDQQFARLAVESGTRAAALDPSLPEVHLALAVTLAGTGRVDDAIKELRTALALRPTYDDARRQLGQVLARNGKIDDAIPEFQQAIALRPGYWGGYSDLGFELFTAGRYPEAAKAFEQVVALQPDSHFGFQQLGTIYQAMGDTPKAIEAYQKSVAIEPSFGVYSNLGVLYYSRGDFQRAVDATQQALKIRPTSAVGYRNLGDAYAKLGRRDEATRAYLAAAERAEANLAVNPKDPRTLASLALFLAKAGRSSDAERRIAQARTLAADDAQVLYRSAVINTLMARHEAALNDIAALVKGGYSVRAIQEEEDFTPLRGMKRFADLTRTPAQ